MAYGPMHGKRVEDAHVENRVQLPHLPPIDVVGRVHVPQAPRSAQCEPDSEAAPDDRSGHERSPVPLQSDYQHRPQPQDGNDDVLCVRGDGPAQVQVQVPEIQALTVMRIEEPQTGVNKEPPEHRTPQRHEEADNPAAGRGIPMKRPAEQDASGRPPANTRNRKPEESRMNSRDEMLTQPVTDLLYRCHLRFALDRRIANGGLLTTPTTRAFR